MEQDVQEASDPNTPLSRLYALSSSKDPAVLIALAANPNCSASLLSKLAELFPDEVMQNPGFSLLCLADQPLRQFSSMALIKLLLQPQPPPMLLRRALEDHSALVRRTLAMCDGLPLEILQRLSEDEDSSVAQMVAFHPSLSPEIAESLLFDDDVLVRRAARQHPEAQALCALFGDAFGEALLEGDVVQRAPYPFSREQQERLLSIDAALNLSLLLSDKTSPASLLERLFPRLERLQREAPYYLLATHPNCPASLWPQIFAVCPRAFLYQSGAPQALKDAAIASSDLSEQYSAYLEQHSREVSAARHQLFFAADALLGLLSMKAAGGWFQHPEDDLSRLFKEPALGLCLEEARTRLDGRALTPSEQRAIERGIAANPCAPEATLWSLVSRADAPEVLLALSQNPALTAPLQRALLDDPSSLEIIGALAANPALSLDSQARLLSSRQPERLAALANNSALSSALLPGLLHLAQSTSHEPLRLACVSQAALSEAQLADFVHAPEDSVRARLASRRGLPLALAETLSRDKSPWVLGVLAANASLPAAFLNRLAQEQNHYLDDGLSRNLNLPPWAARRLAAQKGLRANLYQSGKLSPLLYRLFDLLFEDFHYIRL